MLWPGLGRGGGAEPLVAASTLDVPPRRAVVASPALSPRPVWRAARGRGLPAAGLLAVVVLAAALRLVDLGATPVDPFYDASVRSMGMSWHNLLVGAFDPSARLAIDKPPVALWLQVASTKLLGFTHTALLLPPALAGTLAVAGLALGLWRRFGALAGVAGAAALAVLPAAVITARSDTMDAVMAAAMVAAFGVAAAGLDRGRPASIAGAGALLGLAFAVKLQECLVLLAPLALMWWLGAPGSRRGRATGLVVAGAAFVAVALAWLVAVSVVPATQRPFAFGSTHGSAWDAALVYDGWDRIARVRAPREPAPRALTGVPSPRLAAHRRVAVARAVAEHRRDVRAVPGPPGPLRLLGGRAQLLTRVGLELLAAWLALIAAVALGARELGRPGRAALVGLAAWLLLGTLLASFQQDLRPRYLEALDPAIAGCLGASAAILARSLRARRLPGDALVTVALAAVLAVPAGVSVAAVRRHAQDSGAPGAIPSRRLADLSFVLRARQGSAPFEAASVAAAKAGALIAHDGRPVLILTATDGRPLVSVARLRALVDAGQVTTALVGSSCTPDSPDRFTGCSPAADWIRAHGRDVSRQSGQPHGGLVYALTPS